MKGLTIILGNEAEIKVAKIVVNRTTTGQTSYNLYSIFLAVFIIDFFNCILVLPDNDRWGIDIEQQIAIIL
ncbi:hypothetical protein D3C81_1815970 [compost metagenome]